MLLNLSVKNVILIESINISFGHKLSVLTGETGAGKSILLDALSLALGSRADASLIKPGEDQAQVSAIFELKGDHEIFKILEENEIEKSDPNTTKEIIIRRTLSKDGKSRAFINDTPVSITLLKSIGNLLVEIHGQFENHGLMNPATHKGILDDYGKYSGEIKDCQKTYKIWKDKERERKIREETLKKAKEDEEYLRHNIDELTKLNPKKGEENELAEKRKFLMNSEKISSALKDSIQSLNRYGADPEKHISEAAHILDRIDEEAKTSLLPVINSLETAVTEINNASELLNQIMNQTGDTTSELEKTEERLFSLRAAARKYNVQVNELSEVLQNLQQTLKDIDNSDDALKELIKQETEAKQKYITSANKLHTLRTKAADKLNTAINKELPPLKLEKAEFEAKIEKLAEDKWNQFGFDDVTFLVSTNPGSPKTFIHKSASGGELARFMLAIKVILAEANPVASLVFDEVDTGISGATASAVGERLSRLSENVQVMVVTHSAQVAAFGHHHFKVIKIMEEGKTNTMVQHLKKEDRIKEIARIISADCITEDALRQSENLLKTSGNV